MMTSICNALGARQLMNSLFAYILISMPIEMLGVIECITVTAAILSINGGGGGAAPVDEGAHL